MVDTEPISHRAWAQLLNKYGFDLEDEVYSRMIGHRIDVGVQIFIGAYDIPLTAAEIIRRKTAIFNEMMAHGVPVMPGLVELQAEINRRALPWAVATSSPRHHAEFILTQLGLRDTCWAIAAGDEVHKGKPAPDIYLLAAERLGKDPGHCLALEDSAPGCWAADAAGMRVIAIPNGQTKTADFTAAHHMFDSLHDVVGNLDKLLSS